MKIKRVLFMSMAFAIVLSMGIKVSATDMGTADTPTDFNGNSGQTNISIKVGDDSKNNLAATVPINVTLAVKSDKTIVAPTNYQIANTGAFGVHVTGITTALTAPYTFNATAGANTLNLKLKAGTDTLTLASGNVVLGSASQWNIAAGGNLPLTFSGSVGNIAADLTSSQQVFKVTYTIVAGLAS